MSDNVDWVVDINVPAEEAESVAQKVIVWLIEQEIIVPRFAQETSLSGNPLWVPGPNADTYSIQVRSDLNMCGLEIVAERTVFHTGGNGIPELRCPVCEEKHTADSLPWGEYVQNWWARSGSDAMPCPACHRESSIVDWQFLDLGWGLGNLGFGFNNWAIGDGLAEAVMRITGHRCKIVHEHI